MPNDALTGLTDTKSTAGDGPHYDEDMIELDSVGDDTGDEKDEKAEEEAEEDTDESSEDTEADEEAESDEDEEDLEPVKIPFDRPSVKEIKAKYPDFFNDFPLVKDSIFREAQFTKLFPTVEDAQEAFSDNEAFNTLSEAVLSGDSVPLLDSISQTDKKALEIFGASFLPALYKKDPDAYATAVTPLFENLVRQMFSTSKDENIQNAALVLAEWIFGTPGAEIAKGTKSASKIKDLLDEQKKLKDTKDIEVSTKFRSFIGVVEPSIERAIEVSIMKVMDPDKVFSPFLRKQGAKEVAKRISAQLQMDKGHMSVMGAWWKRAKNAGYPDEYKDKIVSTYLARAKSLIPGISAKVSAAMLGTKEKAVSNKRDRIAPVPKQNNSGGVPRSGQGTKITADYSKMSDMDILES